MKVKMVSVVVALVMFVAMVPNPLSAYQVFGYWPPASIIYDYHTLSSSWQPAVSYGSSRWNGWSLFEWAPGTTGSNDIYTGSIDGALGVLGRTTANLTDSNGNVIANGQLSWINIRFDTAENWYTGSSTPTSSQIDLRSVAAHEFGHALGLLHTQSSNCSVSNSSKPTMCGSYGLGATYFRTLQQDDIDGVRFLYSSLFTSGSRQGRSIKVRDGKNIVVDFTYHDLTLDQSVKVANRVVHGIVADVSNTRWNQDNGEYWEDLSEDGTTLYPAMPYFTVTLSDVEDLAGRRRPSSRNVVITVLGVSPLDVEDSEHQFQIGNEIVGLVRRTNLTWRDGERPIIQFVADPARSHFYKATDGLFYIGRDSHERGEGFLVDEVRELVRDLRRFGR